MQQITNTLRQQFVNTKLIDNQLIDDTGELNLLPNNYEIIHPKTKKVICKKWMFLQKSQKLSLLKINMNYF